MIANKMHERASGDMLFVFMNSCSFKRSSVYGFWSWVISLFRRDDTWLAKLAKSLVSDRVESKMLVLGCFCSSG